MNGGCDMNYVTGFRGWGYDQPNYGPDEQCVFFETVRERTAWHDAPCDWEACSLCAYELHL